MNIKPKSISRETLFITAVIALSLIIRLIYLWQYHDSAYWGSLTVDAKFHYLWAKSIAGGDILGSEVFFRAPFYPYFLALCYLIFGGKLLGIVIIQNLIGVISFLLVYKLAKEIFGKKCAMLASILYLFTFDFIFFESELLLDFMLVLFLPLFFLTIFKADSVNKKHLWLMAGLILGLAAATRPTVLILLGIIPLFYLNPGSKVFKFKTWALDMIFLILGSVIILLPIAIRNAAVGDEFTAVPTQGGINFYIGNNPDANGWSAAMPPPLGQFWQYADCKYIAETEAGSELKPAEVSRFWFTKGIDFWLESPSAALRLNLKKAYLLFNNRDISNNRNISQFKEHIGISKILVVRWWLILPFGLVGMIASLRRNSRAGLIIFFTVLYSFVIILFFVTSRFRLPLLPFWIIFTSRGILYSAELISARKIKMLVISALIIILGFLFSISDLYKIDFSNPLQELYSEGNRQFAAGEYVQAGQAYKRLLEISPNYPQANLNLAASFVRLGEMDSARHYYLRELEVNPDSALALSSLAEVARLEGDFSTAYNYARRAISLKPFFVEILINYVKASRSFSMQSEALATIEPLEKTYEHNPYYFFYRGVLKIDLASVNTIMYSRAEADFLNSLRLWQGQFQPTYERDPSVFALFFSDQKKEALQAKSYANIGIINLGKADYEQARESFQTALEYDPDLRQARTGLLETAMRLGDFSGALTLIDEVLPQASPDEVPAFLLYRAQAYYNLGETQKAVEILEGIITDFPDYDQARRILEAIKMGG
jgi:4-amino-4-deoxy-L-arabinose transferase-like glycosyltransferase/Tfp pilus assembly protein PilF